MDNFIKIKTGAIYILDQIVLLSITGFVASMPVSIAFCQSALGIGWVAWLLKCIFEKKWNGFKTKLDLWFGLFFAVEILATIYSDQQLESLIGLKKFYLMSAIYFIAFNVKTANRLKELVWLFVWMTALTGIYGIIMNIYYFQPRLLAVQGMALTSGGIFLMASLLAIPIISMQIAEKKRIILWLAILVNLILLYSLVLTKTVSAWIGWIFGAIAMAATLKRLLYIAILAAIIGGTIYFVQSTPSERFLTVNKCGSWQVRLTLWKIGWRLIKERPVLGYGLIDLAKYYRSKETADDLAVFRIYTASKPSGHLHNNFIHITAISGFVGLAAFLSIWIVIMQLIISQLNRNSHELIYITYGLLSLMIGFLVNGLAEWNFGDSEVVTVIWFAVGLAVVMDRLGSIPRSSQI